MQPSTRFITFISLKWTLLVGLNAIISYTLAAYYIAETFGQHVGMVLGIFTWILIYIHAELFFYRRDLHRWRNSMTISAILKCFTQLYPIIEMWTGALAGAFVQYCDTFIEPI